MKGLLQLQTLNFEEIFALLAVDVEFCIIVSNK